MTYTLNRELDKIGIGNDWAMVKLSTQWGDTKYIPISGSTLWDIVEALRAGAREQKESDRAESQGLPRHR